MAEDTHERWIYEGRRLSRNKIVYVWRDETGKTHIFDKGKAGHVIGGIYDVRVRIEGETVYRIGEPTWTGESIEDTLGLRAQDAQAYGQIQDQRAMKRMNELTEIDAFVEKVAPSLKSFDDIDALVDVIRRKLFRAKR